MEFFFLPGTDSVRQSSTGQMETHSVQPMHSAVRMVFFEVNVIDAGQVFSHFLQSIQASSSRLT